MVGAVSLDLGAMFYGYVDAPSGADHDYFEFQASVPLGPATLGAGVYTAWNVGAGYALNDHLGLDLRYHDTDKHRFGDIYDSRVVLSLEVTF